MKKPWLIYLLFLGVLQSQSLCAQTQRRLDSLRALLSKTLNDTTRCNVYFLIGDWYSMTMRDSSIFYWERTNSICDTKLSNSSLHPAARLRFLDLFSETHLNLGFLYLDRGKTGLALSHFKDCLKANEELNDKKAMASCYNNMAFLFENQGNVSKGLEYFEKALALRQETGDKKGMATVLNNLGGVYNKQGDPEKALEYYKKAYEVFASMNNKKGIANMLNNIANVHRKTRNTSKVKEYFEEALKIYISINDQNGIATVLNNLATEYVGPDPEDKKTRPSTPEELKKAEEYLEQSLKIREGIKDVRGIISCMNNLAGLFRKKKDLQKAIVYSTKAMELGRSTSNLDGVMVAAQRLTAIYKGTGDHKRALEMYELFVRTRDSLSNEGTRKAAVRSQLKYEYEKQAAADSVAHAKENEVKSAELSRQSAELRAKKNQQYALFGGLALVMVFAGFMYNRFKVTQKQKAIIESQKMQVEEQKKLVEEKQKEVLDSIHYARRIQLAQIPSEKRIEKMLGNFRSS